MDGRREANCVKKAAGEQKAVDLTYAMQKTLSNKPIAIYSSRCS